MGLCISKKSRYMYGNSYEKPKKEPKSESKINRLFSEYKNEDEINYSDIIFSSSSSESDYFSSSSSSSSSSESSSSSNLSSDSNNSEKEIRKHWNKCSIYEIKYELKKRNLSLLGKKSELIERLLIDFYKNE